jgi:hypothetical protein
MAKSQTATTHPKAAPNQLLSSAMATLASKLNSASIVKKSAPHLAHRVDAVLEPVQRGELQVLQCETLEHVIDDGIGFEHGMRCVCGREIG